MSATRKERLAAWLVDENRGYVEVSKLVAREWGVRTSRTALGSYFRQRLVPQQLADATEAAEAMCPPSPSLRRMDNPFGEAALQRARQLGFMALMEPVPDLKAAKVLLGLVDTIERRELARERIELRERLVKLRERKETPPEPPEQTYEEKVEELCGIFGVEPAVYHERVRQQEEAARRAIQSRNAEGGTREVQTGSAELGTREEAKTGECASQPGRSETAPLPQPGTENQTETVAESPGVPGSFHVSMANPEVFSRADGSGRGDGNDGDATQKSIQPRIAQISQIAPIPGSGDDNHTDGRQVTGDGEPAGGGQVTGDAAA